LKATKFSLSEKFIAKNFSPRIYSILINNWARRNFLAIKFRLAQNIVAVTCEVSSADAVPPIERSEMGGQ